MISNANKIQDQEIDEDTLKIDWPEDSVEKAKIIRTKVQSMTLNVEAVSNSFITGMLVLDLSVKVVIVEDVLFVNVESSI